MDKLEESIIKGDNALRILNDPLVEEIFTTIEQEVFDLWKHSKTDQPEERERIYLFLKALRRVRETLEATAENGQYSRQILLSRLSSLNTTTQNASE